MQTLLSYVDTALMWVGDVLCGWSLWLPREVTLLFASLLTAAGLVGLRLVLTDQAALLAATHDLKTLRNRRRDCRDRNQRNDIDRLRYRVVLARLRHEWLSLLASTVLILGVVHWANARLAYRRPSVTNHVELEVMTPLSLVGETAHVVPTDELIPATEWIQIIQREGTATHGTSHWRFRAKEGLPSTITVRLGSWTVVHRAKEDQAAQRHQIADTTVQSVLHRPLFRPAGLSWKISFCVILLLVFFAAKRIFAIA